LIIDCWVIRTLKCFWLENYEKYIKE
jgi:hypothetical protein